MENPRRARFKAWYAQHYKDGAEGRAKFMIDTGKRGETALTKGRLTQLFDDDEPFGELAARNLALRLGLMPDYFEHDHPESGIPLMVTPEEHPKVKAFLEGLRANAGAKLHIVPTDAAAVPPMWVERRTDRRTELDRRRVAKIEEKEGAESDETIAALKKNADRSPQIQVRLAPEEPERKRARPKKKGGAT